MRKVLTILATIGFAYVSQAAYLYWQVSDISSTVGSYNTARVGYTTTGDAGTAAGYLQLYSVGAGGATTAVGDNVGLTGGASGMMYADFGEITTASYKFFIELANYDSGSLTRVAYSDTSSLMTYQNLVDKGYTSVSMTPTIAPMAWHGGTFKAAPEPTSAMLVMVGLGLMALKRRNVRKEAV